MLRKGMTGAIFMVQQLKEKFLVNKNALFYAFIDLEKVSYRVPIKVV